MSDSKPTTTSQPQQTAVSVFSNQQIQKRFEKLLGQKAPGFISSVLQVVNNSSLLKSADPTSVLNAAATAAALDLPINQNLGFAWIVPFKGKAQFQIGWKGYMQLALRTGQYSKINVVEIYENQFKSFDALTEELRVDLSATGTGKIVGFAAFFRLNNGFEKTTYWTREQMEVHAKKYSQSYKNKQGVWADGEDGFVLMGKKTLLKNTISKWGIMSIEMQTAQLADQSIVVDAETGSYQYVDSVEDQELINETKEADRALEFISKCETLDDLEMLQNSIPDPSEEVAKAIRAKQRELSKAAK